MPVTALPLDPGAQACALLHHLLEAGDVIGCDQAGWTVITLPVDDQLLEQLLACAGGLEDGGDAEPDEGPAMLSIDQVPARRVYRGRPSLSGRQLRKIVHRYRLRRRPAAVGMLGDAPHEGSKRRVELLPLGP